MSDFKTALLTDPRLSQISDSQIYAVQSGASNNTHQSYEAVSKSASSLVFNVQCPSESVVVDREILMEVKDFTFRVTKSGIADGTQNVFDFSKQDALGPFPLNFSFNTLTSQINNSSVTMNSKDILPFLVRMNDADRLYKYHAYTPVLPDQEYLKYSDAQDRDNNPLADGSKAGHNAIKPRGSFVIKSITYAGSTATDTPTAPASGGPHNITATIVCDITEPVMLSPYIFGAPDYNCGGFVGINTLNLVGNLDSKPHRVFRCSEAGVGANVTSDWGLASDSNPFRGSARLLVNYLSTQSTQLIPSRQVLPYMDFPRYLSTGSAMNGGTSATVRSQNIQLNQIPDKFILAVRKKMTDQSNTDSDSFFPIEKVTVSLNNQSGLLSSASPQHLWKMSQEAGSTQTWSEFSGEVHIGSGSEKIPTTGSMLVLSPAQHLSLSAMLSSGSIGQFSVQFDVTVKNPYGVELTPELCLVCVNSGIMVNAAGSTAVYTGILTKELVVSTQTEQEIPPLERPEYERMVGGASCNIGSLRKMLMGKLGRVRGSSSGGAMSAGVRRFA